MAVDDLVFEVRRRGKEGERGRESGASEREREEKETSKRTTKSETSFQPLARIENPKSTNSGDPRRHEHLRRGQVGAAPRLRGVMRTKEGRRKKERRSVARSFFPLFLFERCASQHQDVLSSSLPRNPVKLRTQKWQRKKKTHATPPPRGGGGGGGKKKKRGLVSPLWSPAWSSLPLAPRSTDPGDLFSSFVLSFFPPFPPPSLSALKWQPQPSERAPRRS